jgi:hypothetical protein
MARLVIGPRRPSTTSVPAEALVRASAGREDERDAAVVEPALTAAPLARVSPATVLQCGQAPGPWACRTFCATVICAALLARFAVRP